MQEFVDDRKERKKPMTGRAVTLNFKKLEEWYGGNYSKQVACIYQSIENGWMGLFKLQEDKYRKTSTGITRI